MTSDELETLASRLFQVLQSSFLQRPAWAQMQSSLEALAHCLSKYCSELRDKNKMMKLVHSSGTPWRTLSKGLDVFYLTPTTGVLAETVERINSKVIEAGPYSFVDLHDLTPSNPKTRYNLVKDIKSGLKVPVILLVNSPGNNYGNSHFICHVPDSSLNEAIRNSQTAIEEIKAKLPIFHSRQMRREFVNKFGRVSSTVKPAVLRYFYRDLTGDSSNSETSSQKELDDRVKQMIEMEDPDIVADLRHMNSGSKSKYDHFWEECSKFLEQQVGTAVDDRRHSDVTHVATAISVRDLRDQVAAQCAEGTPIPSVEWLRLQFWPKTVTAKTAIHYTGRFKVRSRVQQRQWRKDHPDVHYAAGIFWYEREYAVMMREYSSFFCLDDKHRIKVGEPNFPVAATERGRQVLTAAGSQFLVGDHDFTTFSLIPSVILHIDIPDDISGSWYTGQVHIGLKDGALEASSPTRHMTELLPIVELETMSKPIVFLYSDGGPDHRLTYISVQLTLISLFLHLDLDYLCAARTAPFHSWRNPVERMMSIVNLGLQCIGLARGEMGAKFERKASRAKSLKDLRHLAEREPVFRESAVDSMSSVKVKLTQILLRLKLKNKNFKVFTSVTSQELDNFCNALLVFDASLNVSIKKGKVGQYPRLQAFIQHCCHQRHYFFDILKCGKHDCDICKPVRLPEDVFQQLHHLPDPTPGPDGHFLPFEDIIGKETTEEHRPSFKAKKTAKKSLPFSASKQHVTNVDMMLQCDECGLWRLLYCKRKLKRHERELLEKELDGLMYTCGASLQDLKLDPPLNEVYVRDVTCADHIEKLYFSAGYEPICIYCAGAVDEMNTDFFPQCCECAQPKVARR